MSTIFISIFHSHVWWKLKKVDTHVKFHLFLGVDVQLFVGINRHQQRANVGLTERVQTSLIVKMHLWKQHLKFFSRTHIDQIFAVAFLEVAEESCLCGFIQKDKILDPNVVPGGQGTFHVQLTLCNKYQP